MLERIHVENYKCLREVTVDLGGFNVLIGPNDSGKSSFLSIVHILGEIANLPFGNVFGGDKSLENLVWRKQTNRNIVLNAKGGTGAVSFSYQVEIPVGFRPPVEWLDINGARVLQTKGSQVVFADQAQVAQPGGTFLALMGDPNVYVSATHEAISNIKSALASSLEFHFEPGKMAGNSIPETNAPLSPTGDNLAGFLDGLLSGPDRSAFVKLEHDLHEAIPTLRGIALPAAPSSNGQKSIRFVLAGNGSEPVTIPASLASGGALLLTAFLALSHSKTPDILLIEEPENGLHPSRLQLVVDVLRKMSTGELGGRPRQIIMTTHNPLLLNYVKPEEVRVFVRDPEKGTQVKAMIDIPNVDRLLKEFALGELWYLLGEEKLFEEQPA